MNALDLEGLRDPRVTLWSLARGGALPGCVALLELDAQHGEVKSMHVLESARGQGLAQILLEHLVNEARRRGYRRLSLETGAYEAFAPARRLYERSGFLVCPPFANYTQDPFSVCMTRTLE